MIKEKLNNVYEGKNIFCTRNENILFSNINFTLQSGNVLQVVGENGSGKTTFLRILAGLFLEFSGEIFWRNQSISLQREQYASSTLYLGYQSGMKMALTPYENLLFSTALQAIDKHASSESAHHVLHALRAVGLKALAHVPMRQLSAGQQRRVSLARLFFSNARLWLLDEPFTALDDASKKVIEMRIANHSAEGGITILSTHQPLSFIEAQQLALRGMHVERD